MTKDQQEWGVLCGLAENVVDRIARVSRPVVFVCRWATVFLLGLIVIVVGAGVWWRYILNDSLFWTEEIAKYLMVWMTFTGAPVAYVVGGHVAIEFLPNSLSGRLRQLAYLIVHATTVFVTCLLAYYSFKLALNARAQVAATAQFSLFYVMVAMPAGISILAVLALENCFRALAGALGSPRGFSSLIQDPSFRPKNE